MNIWIMTYLVVGGLVFAGAFVLMWKIADRLGLK